MLAAATHLPRSRSTVMSADDKPPPQPPTVKLPAMTDRALLEDLARTMRGVANEVTELRAEVGEGASQIRSMDRRLSRVEEKVDEFDGRLIRNSSRAQATSSNDLKQDAAISQVIVRLEAVEVTQKKHSEAITNVHDAVDD